MIRKQRVEEVAETDDEQKQLWRLAVIAQILTVVFLAPSVLVPIIFTTHLLTTHATPTLVALAPLTALAFPAAVIVIFHKLNG